MTNTPDPALAAPLTAALQTLLADDEACLRMAEAYDREDAAQRGEADPHGIDRASRMGDYADWAADRIACTKEAIRAAIAAGPQIDDLETELAALVEAVTAMQSAFIPFSDDQFRAVYAVNTALAAVKAVQHD